MRKKSLNEINKQFFRLMAINHEIIKDNKNRNRAEEIIRAKNSACHVRHMSRFMRPEERNTSGFSFNYLPDNINYDSYNKATVEEIIEHFKAE